MVLLSWEWGCFICCAGHARLIKPHGLGARITDPPQQPPRRPSRAPKQHPCSGTEKYFPQDEQLHFLALVHDLGKARVHDWDGDDIVYRKPEIDHIIHTIQMMNELGFRLTDEQLNALQFHHGGWSAFKGTMAELAVKLHFCDMMVTVGKTI